MEIPKKKFFERKTVLVFGSAILFLLIIVSFFYFIEKKKMTVKLSSDVSYTIPNVPYFGIFNEKGPNRFLGADASNSIASLLEYWNPGQNDFTRIRNSLPQGKSIFSFADIQQAIQAQGPYKVENVHLETNELKKYINPETKTPLLFFLPLDENQPLEVSYYSAKVLIGIDEQKKNVAFHDYWLGNNYEMSFDEFNKLWQGMKPDWRNFYLVIQPEKLEDKLKEINSKPAAAYPPRKIVMEKAQTMIKNYCIGASASKKSLWDIALDYYSKVMDDPNYNSFLPPYFKVQALSGMAGAYRVQGSLDKATDFANQAVSLDHDLDQAFGDWDGIEIGRNQSDKIGQLSGPFRVLGDIYKANGDSNKAQENYLKALQIYPLNKKAQEGLTTVAMEGPNKKK